MGILKKLKFKNGLKRILKGVGLGALDAVGLGTITNNIESRHTIDKSGNPSGFGHIDWVRLGTFIIIIGTVISVLILVLGVVFGKIPLSTAVKLIETI